ncbi:MAG TPA: hypothetical protein VIC85_03985 [Ktedonobacterales bacterium]|jgi:hypothetical protein
MKRQDGDTLRLVALGAAVLLEAVALLSVVLQSAILPPTLGSGIYPNVVSVAVFVLPSLVGLLSRRLATALLFGILPFWALAVVYLAVFAPIYVIDLIQLGVLAERVAATSILLALLAALGWVLRSVLFPQTTSTLGRRRSG